MNKILVAGTGPVGVQLAHIANEYMKSSVSMVGRVTASSKSKIFYDAYQEEGQIDIHIQNEKHNSLSGQTKLKNLYKDYESVDGVYDVLVMACTANAYREVLVYLPKRVIASLKCIILISPTFGSHIIVQQLMKDINLDVEVISFSTYLGDTRVPNTEKPNRVLTTGVKENVYIGSTFKESKVIEQIKAIFKNIGIQLTLVESPFIAESRNSSLYVHPALFMNEFSLNNIFYSNDIPVYVYKLFPEGPITMTLIREMRLMWQEVMNILKFLHLPTLNLLKFMVKENYPLRPETINEQDIERFENLPNIHQEYLLYVRYTGILIDPFSKPNDKGEYFDFSAVPFHFIYKNDEGVTQIPRMSSEDFYRTKIIQAIGKLLSIETPMIDQFLNRYTSYVATYKAKNKSETFSLDFNIELAQPDISLLESYFKKEYIDKFSKLI